MKILKRELLEQYEGDLMDGIQGEMDWGIVDRILAEKHGLTIDDEDLEIKQQDMIVHEGEVAYLLEFEVKANLRIVMDRKGNYLGISLPKEEEPEPKETDVPHFTSDDFQEEMKKYFPENEPVRGEVKPEDIIEPQMEQVSKEREPGESPLMNKELPKSIQKIRERENESKNQ